MGEFYGRKKKRQENAAIPIMLDQTPKVVNPYRDYYSLLTQDPFEEASENYVVWDRGTEIQINHSRPKEIEDLWKIVRFLYSKIEKIENTLPEVVEVSVPIEEVPIDEAKLMIQKYLKGFFKKNKRVYPSDIADALGLNYETVREVFDVLESEGKLKECK